MDDALKGLAVCAREGSRRMMGCVTYDGREFE